MSDSSYRTILRASAIIGGSQLVSIAAGLIKMKAIALWLGPTGVGLFGYYLNLIQTVSAAASLGMVNAGTRQVAIAHTSGDNIMLARTRRALFWGMSASGIVGALLFWLSSGWIAGWMSARAAEVGLLSIGIALTVAAGPQIALLKGLRRTAAIAWITTGASGIGAILGILALWLGGSYGLIAMVLTAPAVAFLLGHIYVARLQSPAAEIESVSSIALEWWNMVRFGIAFVATGMIGMLGELAIRTFIQRELGAHSLGYFQAAWTIGMTYIGFVFSAMVTDYFPRLAGVIKDHGTAARVVNEQTEVGLLLSAPVILAMLGLAPWVIRLIYSAEFSPAVDLLRWMLLGDVLKIISWPLGYIIVAAGAGRTFIATESVGTGVLVLGILIGLPVFGLMSAGIAFILAYVVYLPLVWWLAWRKIAFRWSKAVIITSLVLFCAAALVRFSANWSDTAAAVIGLGAAFVFGIVALIRLSAMSRATGLFAWPARFADKLAAWNPVKR